MPLSSSCTPLLAVAQAAPPTKRLQMRWVFLKGGPVCTAHCWKWCEIGDMLIKGGVFAQGGDAAQFHSASLPECSIDQSRR